MKPINLKKNIALSGVSKALTLIASFITNWFLARYLGPELRGKYVYLFTLNSIIWMFLDLGVHQAFPYLVHKSKVEINNLKKLNFLTFAIGIGVVFAIYLLAGSYLQALVKKDYPPYVLLSLGILIISFQYYMRTQSLQLAADKVQEYSIWAFVPTFAFMILVIPLFWLMPPALRLEYSFLLYVVVFLVSMAIMLYRFREKPSEPAKVKHSLVSEAYKLGLRAFASEYLIILLMRVDMVILKALGSYAQVGIYALAVNFVDLINMSCNTIGAVLLVKLTSLKDELSALMIMRRIFLIVSVVNTIAVLAMFVLGRWFIVKLYGFAYADAYTAFMLMIPAIFGITLGALFNTFIWSKGFPLISIIAPIAPLLLKLGLNYLLVPRYGMFGTSVASSICYMLWLAILLAWYFLRHPDISIKVLLPTRTDFNYLYVELLAGIRKMMARFHKGTA